MERLLSCAPPEDSARSSPTRRCRRDKTKESMVELDKELRGILGNQPVTEEELSTAQKNQTLQLPGRWETDDGGCQFHRRNRDLRVAG